jgi:hypothetical protein
MTHQRSNSKDKKIDYEILVVVVTLGLTSAYLALIKPILDIFIFDSEIRPLYILFYTLPGLVSGYVAAKLTLMYRDSHDENP